MLLTRFSLTGQQKVLEFTRTWKSHFALRRRCSTVQIVPDFKREKGRRMLSDEDPSFTRFHFSQFLACNTITHPSAHAAASHCVVHASFLHLPHWFSDGFVMFMQQFEIQVQHCFKLGINATKLPNTKAGVWSAALHTLLQSVLFLWAELQASERYSRTSWVHLQTSVCIAFKYRRLLPLQVSTRLLSGMPLEQRITHGAKEAYSGICAKTSERLQISNQISKQH